MERVFLFLSGLVCGRGVAYFYSGDDALFAICMALAMIALMIAFLSYPHVPTHP
jgi:hypothetical protein